MGGSQNDGPHLVIGYSTAPNTLGGTRTQNGTLSLGTTHVTHQHMGAEGAALAQAKATNQHSHAEKVVPGTWMCVFRRPWLTLAYFSSFGFAWLCQNAPRDTVGDL